MTANILASKTTVGTLKDIGNILQARNNSLAPGDTTLGESSQRWLLEWGTEYGTGCNECSREN